MGEGRLEFHSLQWRGPTERGSWAKQITQLCLRLGVTGSQWGVRPVHQLQGVVVCAASAYSQP